LNDREIQEKRAREATQMIAEAVGLSAAELDQIELMIDTETDETGRVKGHIVYFLHYVDPRVLSKVDGLVNGRWVRIGPLE
jgi:hypothetical protein